MRTAKYWMSLVDELEAPTIVTIHSIPWTGKTRSKVVQNLTFLRLL